MSALEQHPLPSPSERRNGERKRVDRILQVMVGRYDGVFVDASIHGAKIRHAGVLRRGDTVRLGFEWERERFSATAQVLSSRVVALGTREGESTTFESRFLFVSVSPASSELLARVLGTLSNDELRTWVGNMKGFGETAEPVNTTKTRAAGFIRCRRIGMRWDKKWTRDAAQPSDGFLLPAGTDPAELAALCSAWETMDDDARHMVRLTAAAVVEGAGGKVN